MIPWIKSEGIKQFLGNKSSMKDVQTDTCLDEESFKSVPCTCRMSDKDSETSCTSQITPDGFKPTAFLRECYCAREKGKELFNAVSTGNSELLEICLDYGFDINSKNQDGDTLLHIASERGDSEMVSFLSKQNNIDVNAQNSVGLTPLAVAVIYSQEQTVDLLLNNGADPNISDNKGRTPIIFSVQAGNMNITVNLINHHAEVNTVDRFGNTPLLVALIDNPIMTMVKVLLSNGANPALKINRLCPFLETVLACTTFKKMEMVKVLVDHGVNVNVVEPYSNRNCLHFVAINGFLPLAKYLVNAGATLERLDISDRSPDQVASEHNNKDIADFFLKAKLLKRIFHKQRLKRKFEETSAVRIILGEII